MANHQLTAPRGILALAADDPLLYVYPLGDCDFIPWPFTAPKHAYNLTGALYDYYQCNEEPLKDGDTVSLPDGTHFGRVVGVHFIQDFEVPEVPR